MKTMITLGDMTAKSMTVLVVACRRCDRRGRLSIARLIAERGCEENCDLRAIIAADCPKMQSSSASIYDQCVHFPELPRWYLRRRGS